MSLNLSDIEAQLKNMIAQRDMMQRNFYQLQGAIDILTNQFNNLKKEIKMPKDMKGKSKGKGKAKLPGKGKKK